jgi:hypothetical protein
MSATLIVPGGVTLGSAEEFMSNEGKVEAFKSDPQLMEAASRFVAEVLEKAKEEAARRSQQNKVSTGAYCNMQCTPLDCPFMPKYILDERIAHIPERFIQRGAMVPETD